MSEATDTTTAEPNPEQPINQQGPFGDAEVRIVVDEPTADRLREGYGIAGEQQGLPDAFHQWVLNNVFPTYALDVDDPDGGEEIEATARYDSDADAEHPVSIELELPDGVDREEALDSVDISIAGE